jgi:hypothetical protein
LDFRQYRPAVSIADVAFQSSQANRKVPSRDQPGLQERNVQAASHDHENTQNISLYVRCVSCSSASVELFLTTAHAQLTRSTVLGTVTDTTDAVMVGAQVTLRNLATGTGRQVSTDESGVYRFLGIEPGDYSIEFALPGFQTRRVVSFRVGTAQEVGINQALPVNPVVSQVEVVEPLGDEVAKTTPTISRTLGQLLVAELATTTGRDVTRLSVLAPLVSRAPGSNEFTANGQRARNTDFLLDGSENNDLTVTLPSARMIPEGIAEFQIKPLTYSAEFGRNSGAQVSVITRNGTSRFHGEGWNYYRGNWMEPLALANKRAGLKETPRFVQNQGGGSIGGPLIKDRTFFFGLFEVNRPTRRTGWAKRTGYGYSNTGRLCRSTNSAPGASANCREPASGLASSQLSSRDS